MKQGQLIVNCIKLLNENNGVEIDPSIVSTLPEYEERTTTIVPSINRAFQRLSDLNKLPVKQVEIEYNKEKQGNVEVPKEITEDIIKVENVLLFDRRNNFANNISRFFNGSLFLLPPLMEGQKYFITYRPKAIMLEQNKPYRSEYGVDDDYINHDSDEINYPDYILNCIPYFVCGEIYMEDSPQLAAYYNNKFEAVASQIVERNESYNSGTTDVYGLY